MRRPSEGLEDAPWPISAGKMRKYLWMSRGCSGPKRTVEKRGLKRVWASPPVPWRRRNGVVDVAVGVAVGGAEGEVVELEVGEGFARAEVEVVGDVVARIAGVGGCGLGADARGARKESG